MTHFKKHLLLQCPIVVLMYFLLVQPGYSQSTYSTVPTDAASVQLIMDGTHYGDNAVGYEGAPNNTLLFLGGCDKITDVEASHFAYDSYEAFSFCQCSKAKQGAASASVNYLFDSTPTPISDSNPLIIDFDTCSKSGAIIGEQSVPVAEPPVCGACVKTTLDNRVLVDSPPSIGAAGATMLAQGLATGVMFLQAARFY